MLNQEISGGGEIFAVVVRQAQLDDALKKGLGGVGPKWRTLGLYERSCWAYRDHQDVATVLIGPKILNIHRP
jgi:hypothetical protein